MLSELKEQEESWYHYDVAYCRDGEWWQVDGQESADRPGETPEDHGPGQLGVDSPVASLNRPRVLNGLAGLVGCLQRLASGELEGLSSLVRRRLDHHSFS